MNEFSLCKMIRTAVFLTPILIHLSCGSRFTDSRGIATATSRFPIIPSWKFAGDGSAGPANGVIAWDQVESAPPED